ncbi:uncharacterized protein VTP21DRAFT_5615 [Calcarisporiella thermophila]|uniref:uncharacterized protein n=1 Tax=Calcarisporiella thermophila TaxID=911321 RepID=UPI003742651A
MPSDTYCRQDIDSSSGSSRPSRHRIGPSVPPSNRKPMHPHPTPRCGVGGGLMGRRRETGKQNKLRGVLLHTRSGKSGAEAEGCSQRAARVETDSSVFR